MHRDIFGCDWELAVQQILRTDAEILDEKFQ